MTPVPATPAADSIEQRVAHLLGRWLQETAYQSSNTRITGAARLTRKRIVIARPRLLFAIVDLEQTVHENLS